MTLKIVEQLQEFPGLPSNPKTVYIEPIPINADRPVSRVDGLYHLNFVKKVLAPAIRPVIIRASTRKVGLNTALRLHQTSRTAINVIIWTRQSQEEGILPRTSVPLQLCSILAHLPAPLESLHSGCLRHDGRAMHQFETSHFRTGYVDINRHGYPYVCTHCEPGSFDETC